MALGKLPRPTPCSFIKSNDIWHWLGRSQQQPFGTAGFIAEQATEHNQIGIVLSNVGPAIAPSRKKNFAGNQSLGLAFPNEAGGAYITRYGHLSRRRGRLGKQQKIK